MFRLSRISAGGFIIYPRVVADWRQFFMRDDAHTDAKKRLEALQDKSTELTPQEADTLLDVFTKSHNSEGAMKLIQMMREERHFPIVARHYHSMLRVFNFDRDKTNLEMLFRLTFERGCANQETVALAIDAVHVLAPKDATKRVVSLLEAADTAFDGVLVCPTDPNSTRGSKLHSPILSSLLHHVTHDPIYAAYLPIVVATWIQSLGVTLGDWDYVNMIAALAAKPSEFPVVRRVIGHFDDASSGTVKLVSLIDRILDRGEPSAATITILDAIRRLAVTHTDTETPVKSGIVNCRITKLPRLIEHMVHKAVLDEPSLGPHQVNAFPTLHTVALVLSVLRQDTAAVGTISLAHQLHKKWIERFVDHSGPNPVDGGNSEPFAPMPHFLLDVGALFAKCSDRTLQKVTVPFASLAEITAATALDTDVALCGAHALLLIRTNDEARQAWQHIVASVDSDATRVPYSVRALVKKFVELCCRHPAVRNAKLTEKGFAERDRWGRYLEARDTSLALFGQVRQAKDVMRHLFFNNGTQQSLRSEEMCKKDVNDVAQLFGLSMDDPFVADVNATKRRRQTAPLLRCSRDVVPRHLFDPNVVNTFPHRKLRMSPSITPSSREEWEKDVADGSSSSGGFGGQITEDFFPDVWSALMRSNVGLGAGMWFLKDPEMFMHLLHGLIQRLDWEAAVQLTLRATPNFDVTFLMDQEIQQYFDEIGDPVGALAFKTATKLYDARIQPNVASKRALFHSSLAAEEAA